MKMFKKSQMEIMGLALVVILISLGLLFAVKFTALKPATSGARQAYTKTVKAANMLNTLLKTSTDCAGGATVTQLIQDCASTPQITCGVDNSCDYSRSVIQTIFDDTLIAWGRLDADYYFEVQKGGAPLPDIAPFGIKCTGSKESKNQPIPIPGGLVTVTLELCG